MSIQIVVDGTPVAKGRPRFSIIAGHVNTYTDAKTRKYEDRIKQAARIAMIGKGPLAGALAVKVMITLIPPSSWSKKKRQEAVEGSRRPAVRPDADNYAKAAIDGCNKIVFNDDAQITDLIITKRYGHSASLIIVADDMEHILP